MVNINTDIIRGTCNYHQGLNKRTIAMEECSELIQAISKCTRDEYFDPDRHEATPEHLSNECEEIADVLLCIEYLKYIDGITDDDIQEWIDKKEHRQLMRDYGTYCRMGKFRDDHVGYLTVYEYMCKDEFKKTKEDYYNVKSGNAEETKEPLSNERELGSESGQDENESTDSNLS